MHFYQRAGSKRWRKLPQSIPKKDLKILESVKRKAYRLDLQLSLCGIRLGWAGVIGLLPWIGDIIVLYFALRLVRKAEKIDGGLPLNVKSAMMANVMFDFGIGLIPIIGDIINIAYKCNSRNFILLEQYLVGKYDIESHGVSSKSTPNDHHTTNGVKSGTNKLHNRYTDQENENLGNNIGNSNPSQSNTTNLKPDLPPR